MLAPLVWRPSPNYSGRNGVRVTHLVWHSTAGSYAGAVSWLCDPRADASAHLVIREDGGEATQLVRLADKAWHAFPTWNAISIGVEHASRTRGFATHAQMLQSARVFGWLCHLYAIPPVDGMNRPRGIVYHRELGVSGGNHFDGPDCSTWNHFLDLVRQELARGGFRKKWAR